MSLFAGPVARYGLPQRVRSDLGGENVDVWRYMTAQHGDERVVITGTSPITGALSVYGGMFLDVLGYYFMMCYMLLKKFWILLTRLTFSVRTVFSFPESTGAYSNLQNAGITTGYRLNITRHHISYLLQVALEDPVPLLETTL